jgi:hypothetical protein
MADINLTQVEADSLIAVEKRRADDERHEFPLSGGAIMIPLQTPDKKEHFILDISRGRIDLLKGKYQSRARQVIVLVRLDFGGTPHRNPNDEEIPSPHLHIYREGYGDKWAIPAPTDKFCDISDLWRTLEDFMQFCNITQPPYIDRNLFS